MMNMDASYIDILIQWMTQVDGPNLSSIQPARLKPGLQAVFPVFVALYALVGALGVAGNVALLVSLVRRGVLREPSSVFLVNVAVLGLVLSACVTPMTLTALLLQTWVLGSATCWLYPMLQALPLHATFLAFLAALADRYMDSRHREPAEVSPRTRACIAVAATALIWFVGIALVVPFVLHVGYTDLGAILGRGVEGVGLCSVNSGREDIRKIHMVGLTLMFCFCPAIAVFLTCTTRIILLKRKQIVDTYEMKIRRGDNNYYYGNLTYGRDGSGSVSSVNEQTYRYSLFYELKLINYFLLMVLVYAVCWCPLMVITTAHQFDHKLEGRDSMQADILHLSLMLAAFLSSWVVPIIYAIWRRSLRTELADDASASDAS